VRLFPQSAGSCRSGLGPRKGRSGEMQTRQRALREPQPCRSRDAERFGWLLLGVVGWSLFNWIVLPYLDSL